MHTPAFRPIYFAYVLVFCLCFLVQLHAFSGQHFLDSDLWTDAVQRTAAHLLHPRQDLSPERIDPVYLYPGTTVIIPASALVRMGANAPTALVVTLAALISLAVCVAVVLCERLRPRGYWWIAASALFITLPYYSASTLASALSIPLIAAVALCVLHAYEREPSRAFPWLLGLLGGILLATRLDVGVLFFGGALIALVPRLRSRVFIFGGVALGTFAVLDPFIWRGPIGYFVGIYDSARMMEGSPSLLEFKPTAVLFHTSPVAFISFGLACAFLLLFPRRNPLPRYFSAWLIFVSIAMYGVVTLSPFWQPWYTYPFLALWELMFPLLLYAALKAVASGPSLRYLPATLTALVFGLLIVVRIHGLLL